MHASYCAACPLAVIDLPPAVLQLCIIMLSVVTLRLRSSGNNSVMRKGQWQSSKQEKQKSELGLSGRPRLQSAGFPVARHLPDMLTAQSLR